MERTKKVAGSEMKRLGQSAFFAAHFSRYSRVLQRERNQT